MSEGRSVVDTSLSRLRELSLALPRPGCEWEERPQFKPPASPEAVAAFEGAAGFPLPDDLRRFFWHTEAVVALSVHNGYWIGDIAHLIGAIEWQDFPQSVGGKPAIPVSTDGGGNAFLLSASGQVWCWKHETGMVQQVAESFDQFLARIVADWEAYLNNTPGWQFLV
jgi:hypothetical protein